MGTDAKVIQRGMNVQANDFAVPAGTPVRAFNVDYSRAGVAASRAGFDVMNTGLPQSVIDNSYALRAPSITAPIVRGMWELFSRDRPMMVRDGIVWQFEQLVTDLTGNESRETWYAVPVNLPHRLTLFGRMQNGDLLGMYVTGIANAIFTSRPKSEYDNTSQYIGSAFRYQGEGGFQDMYGTIANDSTQQQIGTASAIGRWYRVADAVTVPSGQNSLGYVSDFNCIRAITPNGEILAGSTTATGSTNGTGTAATFSGASWMAAGGNNIYVADNSNMIRKIVQSTGVVTTLAGATAAGDVDGVGTAARFRGISGLCYDGSQFLYVSESGGHRIRKVDVTTGSVTIFAGALTPTSGFLDGTGTAARFNTPVGIEYVGGDLYVGDSGNNRIRKITTGAVVTTYAGGSTATDGVVGGPTNNVVCALPGVTIRGVHAFGTNAVDHLIVECTTAASDMIDIALVSVTTRAAAKLVHHIARCPSGYPSQASGPNKLDTVGPNAYGIADTRGFDIGNGCLFTTSERPRVIDQWTRVSLSDPQPRLRPLGVFPPEAPSVTSVAGSAFSAGQAWAYRIVCGLKLTDGRIALGPPSERVVCIGSSTAACSGSVTAYPAPGLPYDGLPFLQVYRTRAVSSVTDPGDQMFLCYETPLTYGQGVTLTDNLPDDLLGAELYTNATEDGVAATALPPPNFANDAAFFEKSVVLANFIPRATVRVKLLGVSTLAAGASFFNLKLDNLFDSTTTVNHSPQSLQFTAIAGATSPINRQFQIASGGSAAQNTEQTARNIVACINRSPDAYWYTAKYDESEPGTIIITCLHPGLSADRAPYLFRAGVEAPTTNQVKVTFTSSGTGSSSFVVTASNVATRNVNAIAYSDVSAYDSFPGGNAEEIGPATEAIVRILPTAEVLLAVKDDSVKQLDASFAERFYDNSLSCSQPNSFAKVNNTWIGLFTRGFVALTTSQAIAIGHLIDREVVAQYGNFAGSLTVDFSSAAGVDASGNYLCVFNRRAYCYNAISKDWGLWQYAPAVEQSTDSDIASSDAGMLIVSAFRDSFVFARDEQRGVYWQRDFRREQDVWRSNFADAAYSFSGTLAADLRTISVAQYDSTGNPGTLPPYKWTAPAGAVDVDTLDSVTFDWVLKVTQGGTTQTVQGTVTPATPGLATSAVTIVTNQALTLAAGSVTVVAYAPILMRVTYAPTATPGSNARFGDVLATLERSLPGWVVGKFNTRRDFGNNDTVATGEYMQTSGVCRAVQLASMTATAFGVTRKMSYADVVRIPTPAERAADQAMSFEVWLGAAWQPYALKSVAVSVDTLDTPKVKR